MMYISSGTTIRIGRFTLWVKASQAESLGCTHHARLWGFIPGFAGDVEGQFLWISRSDLLIPIEEALNLLHRNLLHRPGFAGFHIGHPI
jgi:hypothetical protein